MIRRLWAKLRPAPPVVAPEPTGDFTSPRAVAFHTYGITR